MKEVKKALDRAIKKIRILANGIIISVSKSGHIALNTSVKEEIRDVSIISPYGLKSLPLGGEEATVIMNNSSNKALLIGVKNQDLGIEIDIGEVMLYNLKANTYIHLRNNGNIEYKGELVQVVE